MQDWRGRTAIAEGADVKVVGEEARLGVEAEDRQRVSAVKAVWRTGMRTLEVRSRKTNWRKGESRNCSEEKREDQLVGRPQAQLRERLCV